MFGIIGIERRRLKSLLSEKGFGLHLQVLEMAADKVIEGGSLHIPMSIDAELRNANNPDYLALVEKFRRPAMQRTEAIVTSDREAYKQQTGKEWDLEQIQASRENIGGQEAGIMAIEQELLPPLVKAKLISVSGKGYEKCLDMPWFVNAKKLKQAIKEERENKDKK